MASNSCNELISEPEDVRCVTNDRTVRLAFCVWILQLQVTPKKLQVFNKLRRKTPTNSRKQQALLSRLILYLQSSDSYLHILLSSSPSSLFFFAPLSAPCVSDHFKTFHESFRRCDSKAGLDADMEDSAHAIRNWFRVSHHDSRQCLLMLCTWDWRFKKRTRFIIVNKNLLLLMMLLLISWPFRS